MGVALGEWEVVAVFEADEVFLVVRAVGALEENREGQRQRRVCARRRLGLLGPVNQSL